MSAFGGKADIAFCGISLSRSLLGVKRTWLVAAHMSAFDPKRTPAPGRCLTLWYASTVTGVPRVQGGFVRRREFIKGIAGSAVWPLVARAQQTGKHAKVAYLGPSSLALERVQVDALKQRLH